MELVMRPYVILLVLVLLATALCFVFQPGDRKQSFAVGVGIIAAIMTVTPYRQPPTGIAAPPRQAAKNAYIQLAADGGGPSGLVFRVANGSPETAVVQVFV